MSRDRGPDRARAHTTTRRRAHALLGTLVGGVVDRAIELAVLTALTAAVVVVSGWFVVPAVAGAAWWASAEIRLRRARPATTAPVTDAVVTALSRPDDRSDVVDAGVDGRAAS